MISWESREKAATEIVRRVESAFEEADTLAKRRLLALLAEACEEVLWLDELRGKNDLQMLLIDIHDLLWSGAKK